MCRNQPKRFVQLVWVITIVRDNEMIHPLHFDTAPSNFSSRMSWIHCFNQFVFVAQPVPGANGAQSQWFGSYPATLHSPTCISFCHSKSEIFGSESGLSLTPMQQLLLLSAVLGSYSRSSPIVLQSKDAVNPRVPVCIDRLGIIMILFQWLLSNDTKH